MEPTKKQMRAAMKAAADQLPEGTMITMIIASNEGEKGLYMNRISNIYKDVSENHMVRWLINVMHRDKFGKTNKN